MLIRSLCLVAAVGSVTSAHFILQWPPTGTPFDDDSESNAPCGGATPAVSSNSTQVHVDQFAAQIYSSHPAGTWHFLATTDTEAPFTFEEIVPVIQSTGIGNFCITELRAPSSFAGKSGVIQVIDDSVDGTLYQCAPVNFVSGASIANVPDCVNNTGFTATWTSSNTTAASTSTSSGVAAMAMATGMGSVLGLGLLAAGLAL